MHPAQYRQCAVHADRRLRPTDCQETGDETGNGCILDLSLTPRIFGRSKVGAQVPNIRLIERHEVQRATRRRAGEHAQKEREDARQWLRQAAEKDQAIELTLGPDERDETIKARYRAVAKEQGVKIRFQTAASRTYKNRKGNDEREAEVMIILVVEA